jgi:hypothetical protein
VKSLDFFNSLEPKIRAKAFKTVHRLWKEGYLFSLNMDSETYEFYSALSIAKLEIIEKKEEREEEELLCQLCHEPISREESEQYLGCHRDCYTLEFE